MYTLEDNYYEIQPKVVGKSFGFLPLLTGVRSLLLGGYPPVTI